MKTISTAVLLMTVLTAMAQLPAENRVTYKSLVGMPAPLRESVIWQETFESGIPGDWINSETGGIAYWEYRGPDTTPSNDVGTRGSCLPEGTLGAPIQSPTAGDGFVIFDSNWWDDPIGPCGNLGSGDAPAPHLAILQTPSFDLSAYDKVGFSFYQYAKDYDVDMRVEVSISGGAWTDVWTENMIVNAETPKDQLVRINITDEAALQSDVRIRFVFDGQYYFWMIDDVALLELDENNIHIFRPGYGDFDFDAPDHPTGFEEMEYGLYPDEFAPELKFSAWASNYGAAVQTDVGLHA
ncbi:MAG: hypothetical protein JNM00_07950, partial [Flavobacteriales bacterium]|nr:hypothetical protein [Flavobacteriales bacterium]